MKAIFIALDQAHYEIVLGVLSKLNVRGFTAWKDAVGRGSKYGEPHYGSHAWPSVNNAIISIVEDEKVPRVLELLKNIDKESENLGLRAFVWNVEDMI